MNKHHLKQKRLFDLNIKLIEDALNNTRIIHTEEPFVISQDNEQLNIKKDLKYKIKEKRLIALNDKLIEETINYKPHIPTSIEWEPPIDPLIQFPESTKDRRNKRKNLIENQCQNEMILKNTKDEHSFEHSESKLIEHNSVKSDNSKNIVDASLVAQQRNHERVKNSETLSNNLMYLLSDKIKENSENITHINQLYASIEKMMGISEDISNLLELQK